MVFQHKDFHSVIADCIAFLREHPTEAIVMRVKEEYTAVDNTRPFDESVRAAIRQIEELSAVQMRSQWFRQGTPITSKDEFANLTMESMRGKITIMQNFVGAAVHPGAVLGWDSVADIQDDFELTGDDKCLKVRERFEAHKRSFKRSVSVNFLSASKPPLSPPHVNADRVQEYVLRKYIERDTNRKLGIVVMDFPGDRLISRIIHSNPSVKYYMQRPELASLLGRSLLIASFEQDKDGKQRYWEVNDQDTIRIRSAAYDSSGAPAKVQLRQNGGQLGLIWRIDWQGLDTFDDDVYSIFNVNAQLFLSFPSGLANKSKAVLSLAPQQFKIRRDGALYRLVPQGDEQLQVGFGTDDLSSDGGKADVQLCMVRTQDDRERWNTHLILASSLGADARLIDESDDSAASRDELLQAPTRPY